MEKYVFLNTVLKDFASMLECDWRGMKYIANRCGMSVGELRAFLKDPDVNSPTFEQAVFVSGYNIQASDYPLPQTSNEYELFFQVDGSAICNGWAYVIDKRTSLNTAGEIILTMNPDTVECLSIQRDPFRTVALLKTPAKTFIHSYESTWVHYSKLKTLLEDWLSTVYKHCPIDLPTSMNPILDELLALKGKDSPHRDYYQLIDSLDLAMRAEMSDDWYSSRLWFCEENQGITEYLERVFYDS